MPKQHKKKGANKKTHKKVGKLSRTLIQNMEKKLMGKLHVKSRRRNGVGKRGPDFPMSTSRQEGPRRRRVVVAEDEYIGPISGSTSATTCTVTSFAINPGFSYVFPRLSAEASLYQRWICRKLRFYYRPSVSAYATQGQAGRVVFGCNYNVGATVPVSITQVQDIQPHNSGMAYEENLILDLDPKQINGGPDGKFVGLDQLPIGADPTTFHGGLFFVATYGFANTSLIGELHVKYVFELVDAQLAEQVNVPTSASQYHVYTNGTSTAAAPLTGFVVSASSNMDVAIDNTLTKVEVFNQPINQAYLLSSSMEDAAITSLVTYTPTNAAGDNIMHNEAASNEGEVVANTGMTKIAAFTNTAANWLVQLGGLANTAAGYYDLFMQIIPYLVFLNRKNNITMRHLINGRCGIDHPGVTKENKEMFAVWQFEQMKNLLQSGNFVERMAKLESAVAIIKIDDSSDPEMVPENKKDEIGGSNLPSSAPVLTRSTADLIADVQNRLGKLQPRKLLF